MHNEHDIICQAIFNLDANAKFTLIDEDIDGIVWYSTQISKADIEAELSNAKTTLDNKKTKQANLKASAKTKLMNGEALTEDEANVMVGL